MLGRLGEEQRSRARSKRAWRTHEPQRAPQQVICLSMNTPSAPLPPPTHTTLYLLLHSLCHALRNTSSLRPHSSFRSPPTSRPRRTHTSVPRLSQQSERAKGRALKVSHSCSSHVFLSLFPCSIAVAPAPYLPTRTRVSAVCSRLHKSQPARPRCLGSN